MQAMLALMQGLHDALLFFAIQHHLVLRLAILLRVVVIQMLLLLLMVVVMLRLLLLLLLVVHDMGACGLLMLRKLVLKAALLVLVVKGHPLVHLTRLKLRVDIRAVGMRGLPLKVRSLLGMLLRQILGQAGVIPSTFHRNVGSWQLFGPRRQDEPSRLTQGDGTDVKESQEDLGEGVWLRSPLVQFVLLQGAEVGVVLLL